MVDLSTFFIILMHVLKFVLYIYIFTIEYMISELCLHDELNLLLLCSALLSLAMFFFPKNAFLLCSYTGVI